MLLNNKQREFLDSVESKEEWITIIKELQPYLAEDEIINVSSDNDYIVIDNKNITLNSLTADLNTFSFNDFENIWKEFAYKESN